jgi:hypothetical protein
METINYEWLKKIDGVLEKQERHCASYRKDSRNNKGVLIDRYFKFLNGKFFAIQIKDEIFYAMFNRASVTIDGDETTKYYSYGVQFHNGYSSSEFDISFRDEKLKYRSFKLHWNDIIRIKFEEISMEQYWNIVRLFMIKKEDDENI